MATINAGTIDSVRRTLYYRVNRDNVPVQLPYTLCTIDYDFQYWEPAPLVSLSDKGIRQRGTASGAVFLDRNAPQPQPPPNISNEKYSPWAYYGF